MRDYRKIKAWKICDDLAYDIYQVTKQFPRSEMFGLTSQMRRAALSVPANIAEGATRASKKDYAYFLSIAEASLAELGYYIHFARRLKYLTEQAYELLSKRHNEAARTLHGLIQSVKREL